MKIVTSPVPIMISRIVSCATLIPFSRMPSDKTNTTTDVTSIAADAKIVERAKNTGEDNNEEPEEDDDKILESLIVANASPDDLSIAVDATKCKKGSSS